MVNAHHSRMESSLVAAGASHRKALVHHAWQDIAASERDPIMRVVSMHGRVRDRTPGASAVAGLRARASQAMILSRGPLKEHDRKQHDLHERLAHNSIRNLKMSAHFTDSLHGHSLRANHAGPSQMSRYQHRPSSGIARGNVSSQHSTAPQRPHTAPATERKFRRPSGSARQRSGVGKSPSASNLTEQLNDPSSRLVAAPALSTGLSVRPATPPTSSSGTVLGPTWQRRVRGVTTPGDLGERRAGRSRSTEPMLLHQQQGIAASWSGEAPSITDIVAKGPGRPRMKAPVDCWWDEQTTKMSPSRSVGAFGSFAANQGLRVRSSSAGRQKQRTSSFTGLETPSARSPQPNLREDPRTAMRSGSPQVRDRIGSRSRESSSVRRKRMGHASDHAIIGSDTCAQAAPNTRTPFKQEAGLRTYEVHLTGKGDCVHAEKGQLAGTTALQAIPSSDVSRLAKENVNFARCGSGVNDGSSVLSLDGICKDSHEAAHTSESSGQADVAGPDPNFGSCGLQHGLTVKHSIWVASVYAKQSLSKLEAMGCAKSGHQACRTSAKTASSSEFCSVPDCWDNLVSAGEKGMLGTLQESAHSLALDWGITDGWCCSLCDELLDEDGFESDDESCTFSTG